MRRRRFIFFPMLNFDDLNSVIPDKNTKGSVCEFWSGAEAAGTNILGYAPPGSVAVSSIPNDGGDPSRFYYSAKPELLRRG